MKTLSLFMFVCFFCGNILASNTVKKKIDIDNLPSPSGNNSSAIQGWINVLKTDGYLVNVPEDVIDNWHNSRTSAEEIRTIIGVYNNIDAKSFDAIKKEHQLRGQPLPDEYSLILLELWRVQEQHSDSYLLDYLNLYKKQIDYLNGLTDYQWSYLGTDEIDSFTDPGTGYYDLDDFKSQVGLYVPSMNVPEPNLDIAQYFVFLFDENKWPQLVIVDNGAIMNRPVDAQSNLAKIRWKYVTDNDELILPKLDYGHNGFYNLEYDILYIPPKTGRLYWQFYDYSIVANSDVRADSPWVGGIEITACYTRLAEINLAINDLLDPYLAIDKCGNANWTPTNNVYTSQKRLPSINDGGINPNTGPLNGGSTITIEGVNFVTGAIVDLGGSTCTVTNLTSTQINCINAAHTAGNVGITVTNPDGQTTTLNNAYYYQEAPTITSVFPETGNPSGETSITITGSDFLTGATVNIGTNSCTNVTVNSPSSITCSTPTGIVGATDITISNTDGQSVTFPSGFTYQNAPMITSISPSTGDPAGGNTITITGTDFLTTGTTIIEIGGLACTSVTVNSSSQITCNVPSAAAGVVDVEVINPDEQSVTLASGYTYQATVKQKETQQDSTQQVNSQQDVNQFLTQVLMCMVTGDYNKMQQCLADVLSSQSSATQ